MNGAYRETFLPINDHKYLIIDRVTYPDITDFIYNLNIEDLIYAHTDYYYPVLIPLYKLEGEQVDELLNYLGVFISSDLNGIIFFNSELEYEKISSIVLNSFEIMLGKNIYFLRYFDPRVFFNLRWMLPCKYFNDLLIANHIKLWTYSYKDQWYSLDVDVNTNVSYKGVSNFNLIDALESISKINIQLNSFFEFIDVKSKNINFFENYSFLVYRALNNCKGILILDEDIKNYIIHILTYGDHLLISDELNSFLKKVGSVPYEYSYATSLWDKDYWSSLKGAKDE